MTSKAKIDRSGQILSDPSREYDEQTLESEYILDEYRKKHLLPLSKLTIELQDWLDQYKARYVIAQRLKRKPQILRKLRRLSTRLTQLQDIGGCRIVVENNKYVDDLKDFIISRTHQSNLIKVTRTTDYREFGRDESGYRALHLMISVDECKIELQIRSKLQHYWSESIERTSVIYGYILKEQEGDKIVLDYFKNFSNALYDLESKGFLDKSKEIELESKRKMAEDIIDKSGRASLIGGYVNSDAIKAMTAREMRHKGELNNWILVFDWSDGNFVTWDVVGRNADDAVKEYSRYENEYTEKDNFEVVLIGTSNISTVQQTHSHYFGIEHHNHALEGMENSLLGIARRATLDIGARRILLTMTKRKYYGNSTITISTLKNHYCKNVVTFDESLKSLFERGFIIGHDPISLNPKLSAEINKCI